MIIQVRNKEIQILEKENLVSKNVNTYKMDVIVDEEFSKYSLHVVYKNGTIIKEEILGPGMETVIPHEVLENTGTLYIGLFGTYMENEELIKRYVTNLEWLKIIEGAYDKDAEPTEELSPTILEKYLQEMKEFYEESLKDYNDNSIEKLKEYNENASTKLEGYNTNATNKTNDFNSNYNTKKSEVDKVANKVVADKTEVEEMKKSVEESETNAKTSEIKAKDSEVQAQNSANKAFESESNVINIEKNIKGIQENVQANKEATDRNVETTVLNVTESTKQAEESKRQAEISKSNADKTSSDRAAVETMKNEVSSMKITVEATKNEVNNIKNDTEAIKEETEAIKNEALQAKETVENSLESERKISDSKYARALKGNAEETDFTQIYTENEEVENLKIYGEEITQETREGYNLFDIESAEKNVYIDGYFEHEYYGKTNPSESSNTSDYIPVKAGKKYLLTYDYNTLSANSFRGYCFFNSNKAVIIPSYNTLYSPSNKKQVFTASNEDGYLRFSYDKNYINIQIVEGDEEKPFESHGASPSLDYPSEVQITNNQNINIKKENIFDTSGILKITDTITIKSKEDGGIFISTTSSNTWTSIKNMNLSVPIKKGKKLRFSWGKNEDLLKDSSFTPFFWFKDKNGVLFRTLNQNTSSYLVERDIYSIDFGIENFVIGESYNEDFYIELEISETIPNKFHKYESKDIQISLLENQFSGAIREYKDTIEKIDGKWQLIKRIQKLVLKGTETWRIQSTEVDTIRYKIDFKANTLIVDGNNYFSNYFKCYPGSERTQDKVGIFIQDAYVQQEFYIRIPIEKGILTTDDFKAWLSSLYDEGKPVELYCVIRTPEYVELSEELQNILNNIELLIGLNNISIDNGSFSLTYNKSLAKTLEEKDEVNANLQAQIDEIKALLSTPSTSSMLLDNLESEVMNDVNS